MRLSERGKTMLALGSLSVAAVAFEIALLASVEPLPPSGPVAALLDRGFDVARAGAHGTPGLQVAIVRDGKIVYEYAGGTADTAALTRVTEHTRFRAGSITKMFTAVCAMQLVDAGRLDLDAPVATYFSGAPHARRIAVRQLLAQTSGLANYTDLAFSTGIVSSPTSVDGILTPIAAQPLDFAPGSRYEYSNTNFVVLGRIVELLDGRPLAQIARERILVPAGMAESSFSGEVASFAATGYDDAAGRKTTPPFDLSWLYGGGDLVTTASDLARFDIALMNGTLVRASTLEAMTAALNDTGDGRQKYGLGFTLAPFGSRELVGHHGGIPGFESDDEIVVKSHFAIAVLGNSGSFATSSVDNMALAALFPIDFALAEAGAIRSGTAARERLDDQTERTIRAFLSDAPASAAERAALAKLPSPSELDTLVVEDHSILGKSSVYVLRATYGARQFDLEFVFDEDGRVRNFAVR